MVDVGRSKVDRRLTEDVDNRNIWKSKLFFSCRKQQKEPLSPTSKEVVLENRPCCHPVSVLATRMSTTKLEMMSLIVCNNEMCNNIRLQGN